MTEWLEIRQQTEFWPTCPFIDLKCLHFTGTFAQVHKGASGQAGAPRMVQEHLPRNGARTHAGTSR